jgi:hypothetical protein
MADTAVEIKETPVVEKVAVEEVDVAVKKDEQKKEAAAPAVEAAVVEPTSTENGTSADAVDSSETKENGDAAEAVVEAATKDDKVAADESKEATAAVAEEAVADAPAAAEAVVTAAAADTADAPAVAADKEKVEVAANGAAEEANGDSTDSAPAEAVKRKVTESDVKSDETTATPEKKAKLDEPTKDDVQNGAEASEVAA